MSLLSRRRALMSALKRLIYTVFGASPLTLLKCFKGTAVNYKIEGNSVQDGTPTPDTPVEVESVGERTKNLLNPKATLTTLLNLYKGVDVMEYIAQNTILSIKLKEGKSAPSGVYFGVVYKLSTSDTMGYWLIDNGVLKTTAFNLKQLGDTVTHMGIGVYPATQANWDKIFECFDVQLELGTTATPYEPFGKYKVPVVTQGKNLFDKSIPYDDYLVIIGYRYLLIWVGKGNTVTVSLSQKHPMGLGGYCYIRDNGTDSGGYQEQKWLYHNTNDGLCKKSQTFTSVDGYVSVYFNITAYNNFKDELQVEYGTTATDFEPYQEPTITNIYLNEPLRKVGEYADYVDFANGKVVRNIKEVATTSVYGIYGKLTDVIRFSAYLSTLNGRLGTYEMYSNYLKYVKESWYENNETIFKHNSDKAHYYISLSRERLGITDEDTDTEMVNKANAFIKTLNNPKVYYATNTPTEELIDLPQLPTLEGTTIYSVDTTIQPSNMEVSYYGRP